MNFWGFESRQTLPGNSFGLFQEAGAVGGAGAGGEVIIDPEEAGAGPASKSAPMRLRSDILATNVPEAGGNVDLGLDWNVPISDSFDAYVGPGLRLIVPFLGDGYSTSQLAQSDIDVGVTERQNSALWGVGAGGFGELRLKLSSVFAVSVLGNAGLAHVRTKTTGVKPSGAANKVSYCGPDGNGGIAGDVSGECTTDLPAFAQDGHDNNEYDNIGQWAVYGSLGLGVPILITDWLELAPTFGVNMLAAMTEADFATPVGWQGGLGIRIPLGGSSTAVGDEELTPNSDEGQEGGEAGDDF